MRCEVTKSCGADPVPAIANCHTVLLSFLLPHLSDRNNTPSAQCLLSTLFVGNKAQFLLCFFQQVLFTIFSTFVQSTVVTCLLWSVETASHHHCCTYSMSFLVSAAKETGYHQQLHHISYFWCRETVHHQYCYCAYPFCFHTCWGHIWMREAAHPHCQNSDLLSPGLQTTLKKEIWPRPREYLPTQGF